MKTQSATMNRKYHMFTKMVSRGSIAMSNRMIIA